MKLNFTQDEMNAISSALEYTTELATDIDEDRKHFESAMIKIQYNQLLETIRTDFLTFRDNPESGNTWKDYGPFDVHMFIDDETNAPYASIYETYRREGAIYTETGVCIGNHISLLGLES